MRFMVSTIGLTVCGLSWVLYRLFIKRDLRQHMEEARIGVFFIGIWAVLWWLFT